MSEQAPKMTRMEQLHANRAAADEAEKEAERARLEQEQLDFEDDLYDTAGTTDISDAAEQRIAEADVYQEHLAKMAERPSIDYSDPEKSASARRDTSTFETLNEQPTYAEEREQKAADAALEAKFAADPKLRRLDGVSQEVHDLRTQLETSGDDPDLKAKLKNREAVLGELISDYSKSDDYDEALMQTFVWRDDMAALDVASQNALREKNERKAAEPEVSVEEPVPVAETEQSQENETEEAPEDEEVLDAEIVSEPEETGETTPEAEVIVDDETARKIQEELAARVAETPSSESMFSGAMRGEQLNYTEPIMPWGPKVVQRPGPVGTLNPVIDRATLLANQARRAEAVTTTPAEEVAAPQPETVTPSVPAKESWNAATIENFKDAGRWVASFWKNRRRSAERPQDSQSSRTGERRTLSKRWRSRLAVGSVAIAAGFAGFLEGKSNDGSNNVDASAQR